MRRLREDALGPRVDVEALAAHEAEERDARLSRRLDGEAGRRAHRGDDREAGQGGLLEELEAGATAQHEDTVAQRQSTVHQRGADELVDGVVTSHVLANG